MERHDEAEDWWATALRRDPGKAEGHLGLGTARYRQGRLAQAIRCYHSALDIEPDFAAAHASLAIAYLAADCPAQALAQAEEALRQTSDPVDMRLVRASALIRLGRPTEAIADLAWLHDRGAKLGEVGLLECEVNRELGDHEAALVLAARLAEAFPTLPAPLKAFRRIYAEFVASAPAERVAEFVTGVGLPVPRTRPAPRVRRRNLPVTDVIIPVHDGLSHLKACLESVERHRTPTLGQIILVDDGSSGPTRKWLREVAKGRPDIRLVRTRRPSGFTRSVALGVAESAARRFVALNSDCIVGEGWLERLGAAMPASGRVAMVGPWSNNAGWQSLGEVFDATGNYASNPMPSAVEMRRLQERLQLLKVFDSPGTALVHGFCVLVDRKIHDALGGLDVELFPNGYGEFQDLSLRALDAGYELRVAEDCFVGHARGGSLSAERRAERSREARLLLYERHTALRYLSAECAAALHPQLDFTRRRFETLERYCPGPVQLADRKARMTIHGEAGADLSGQRVCLFVSFAPDGRLLPYTLEYLAALKAQGFQTVLILNETGPHRLPPEALDLARVVILRDNMGLDFGAWRDALARLPSLWQAELVLFTNDSLVGPFGGFDRVVQRIVQAPEPLFFLTESDFANPHFQSFFWGLKRDGLANPVVRSFLETVVDATDKTAAIFLYEVFFRNVCEQLAGLKSQCLFPLAELTGADGEIRPTFNPTHHLWRELMRAGFPFLKADFCRKNAAGPDARAWLAEVAACGGDPMLARLHIEAVQVQRTAL